MKLSIRNLTKQYSNGVVALRDVSLEIGQGMFGLLGPNGAGKSTLIRTLATLQECDSGSVHLDDINVLQQQEEVRSILGYLPQEFGLYPRIQAEALLSHLAGLKGVLDKKERKEVVESLLQRTNLWPVRHRNLGTFSGGMKQRFGIAQALLANPRLIIVDEPTAGLDPAERRRFLNLLAEIGENTIVILSTHIVEDVMELCTDMAILNKGELLFKGSPEAALQGVAGKIWEQKISKQALKDYQEKYHVISERFVSGQPEIRIFQENNPGEGFVSVAPDLNDVYFCHISERLKG